MHFKFLCLCLMELSSFTPTFYVQAYVVGLHAGVGAKGFEEGYDEGCS